MIERLKAILEAERLSLVAMDRGGVLHRGAGRGVSDLWRMLHDPADPLRGATVVDKVVGRGAAALMIAGGVKRLYTPLLSNQALVFLERSNVDFSYDRLVSRIRNRANTGNCPVETLTAGCDTPEECLPLIEQFINSLNTK